MITKTVIFAKYCCLCSIYTASQLKCFISIKHMKYWNNLCIFSFQHLQGPRHLQGPSQMSGPTEALFLWTAKAGQKPAARAPLLPPTPVIQVTYLLLLTTTLSQFLQSFLQWEAELCHCKPVPRLQVCVCVCACTYVCARACVEIKCIAASYQTVVSGRNRIWIKSNMYWCMTESNSSLSIHVLHSET